MTHAFQAIDTHPRLIVGALVLALLFFATACTFNAAIPVCHWLFHCDHWFHSGDSVSAVGAATELVCRV